MSPSTCFPQKGEDDLYLRRTPGTSAPRNEECTPRTIGAALQQAPCIIRNRPIKAFDQAPLYSWPSYRSRAGFLVIATNMAPQPSDSSIFSSFLVPSPAPYPRHSHVVLPAISPRISPPAPPFSSSSSFSSYSFSLVSHRRGRKRKKNVSGEGVRGGRGGAVEDRGEATHLFFSGASI